MCHQLCSFTLRLQRTADIFILSLPSDQDPSGLLLLPPKGAPADFDISPILSVMETLLLVATREVRHTHIVSHIRSNLFLQILKFLSVFSVCLPV